MKSYKSYHLRSVTRKCKLRNIIMCVCVCVERGREGDESGRRNSSYWLPKSAETGWRKGSKYVEWMLWLGHAWSRSQSRQRRWKTFAAILVYLRSTETSWKESFVPKPSLFGAPRGTTTPPHGEEDLERRGDGVGWRRRRRRRRQWS